jgi:hypothetical protein
VGQLTVDARGQLFQFLNRLDPPQDQPRSIADNILIPVIELGCIAAALAKLLEQCVALGNGLGILAQRTGIIGICGTKITALK